MSDNAMDTENLVLAFAKYVHDIGGAIDAAMSQTAKEQKCG